MYSSTTPTHDQAFNELTEIATYFAQIKKSGMIKPLYLHNINGAIFAEARLAKQTPSLSRKAIRRYQAHIQQATQAIHNHNSILLYQALGPADIHVTQYEFSKHTHETHLRWLMVLLEIELLEKIRQCIASFACATQAQISEIEWQALKQNLAELLQEHINQGGIAPPELWSVDECLLAAIKKIRIALTEPFAYKIKHQQILKLDQALFFYQKKSDQLFAQLAHWAQVQIQINDAYRATAYSEETIWGTFKTDTGLASDAVTELRGTQIAAISLDHESLAMRTIDGVSQTLLDYALAQQAPEPMITYLIKRGCRLSRTPQKFTLTPERLQLIAQYATEENALALLMRHLISKYAQQIAQQSASLWIKFLWWFTGGVTAQCDKTRTAVLALLQPNSPKIDATLLRAYETTRAEINGSWLGPNLVESSTKSIDFFWYFPAKREQLRLSMAKTAHQLESSVHRPAPPI